MKFRRHVLLALAALGFTVSSSAQLRYSGSDSVEPVVNAARLAFERRSPGFKMVVSNTGSSVGIKELCEGKVALAGSSRPIKPEEQNDCLRSGVQVVEVPVAIDAVIVIVSRKNTQVKDVKLAELQQIFEPAANGKLTNWHMVRSAWPDAPLKTVGVNVKHGTFEFFHGAIGNRKLTRMDYKDTPDHEETARIVAADPGAIGFVPLSVARDFADAVRPLPVDFGQGLVEATPATIVDGRYGKLSRLLYMYVNAAAISKSGPQSEQFLLELMGGLEKYAAFANVTPLSALQYQESLRRVSFRR